MYNGIINVYKEKGYTSHDVVAILRGILGQKKIGHTGTLDPEATGVLPVCLGKGTKIAEYLVEKDKTYIAVFKLGEETDTQDHTGNIVKTLPVNVTEDELEIIINTYIGDIEQLPPMYSAIKIQGKKLYELARKGEVVSRKKRHIHIKSIADIRIELPFVKMTVVCSKGTYIRTLCNDISVSAGTCGHMIELERLESGVFTKETALTLDEIRDKKEKGTMSDIIIPIDILFPYPKITIDSMYNNLLYNGNRLPIQSIIDLKEEWIEGTKINVYDNYKNYMGIYKWIIEKKELVPVKFFNIKTT